MLSHVNVLVHLNVTVPEKATVIPGLNTEAFAFNSWSNSFQDTPALHLAHLSGAFTFTSGIPELFFIRILIQMQDEEED